MVKLFVLNISDTSFYPSLENMCDILSSEKYLRISKFNFQIDRIRSMCGEYLLKYVLWNDYGIGLSGVNFSYGSYKKPFLKDHIGVFFNISHSGDRVVCVVADRPVGTDIEFMDSSYINIAEDFYSDKEKEILGGLLSDEKVKYFYKIWTLKESYLKLLGCGLMKPLKSCYILETQDGWRVFDSDDQELDCTFWNFEDEGYQISVCTRENILLDNIESVMVSIPEIISWQYVYKKK